MIPRLPASFEPNRLAVAAARARAAGRPLIDLTIANPTRSGFRYPSDLLDALALPEALIYQPDPLGLPAARVAVAGDYRRRGVIVSPDRILLTASTSEAYSWLFKLLCRPAGDVVLIPMPSYPLFEHLTRLEGVEPLPYRLEYHGRWSVDEASIVAAWSEQVRGVVVVSPNNPTGSVMDAAQLAALVTRCAAHGAALIIDEVFADYPLGAATSPVAVPPECLTIRLGGLSKSAGLPQVKLGWMALDGPTDLVARARERLELIADTYLSVSTPVQLAAPVLIERGGQVRSQILERIRANYSALVSAGARHPASEVLHADAGWSAVVRVPAHRSEDELVTMLVERDGVLVQPGYFFDFAHEAFVVLSLLAEPDVFAEGVSRLLARASA